jgi:hypothetical protein
MEPFMVYELPYFLAYKMHQPIRRTMIFSLEILEKSNDEWKQISLSHDKDVV